MLALKEFSIHNHVDEEDPSCELTIEHRADDPLVPAPGHLDQDYFLMDLDYHQDEKKFKITSNLNLPLMTFMINH